MAARKNPAKTAPPAEETELAQRQTTTSPGTRKAPAKKASSNARDAAEVRRGRGRPRVSNTDTERVTLRVEKDHMQLIDTLVSLKQYSNRSDAIRQAVKEFTERALEDVDKMLEQQKRKQKLLELGALAGRLDDYADA